MTTTDEKVRRLRQLWLGSGVILWGLVGVWVFRLYQTRSPAELAENLRPKSHPIVVPISGTDDKPSTRNKPRFVADFELVERSGRKVTREDLLGRPWIVCFVFTRCAGPCLNISGKMKKLHDRLKDRDMKFVTISVDPKYDTPEVLTNYAEVFDADPNRWLFLTGDEDRVYNLIQKTFQLPVQQTTGAARLPGFEVVHSTNIVHVDAEGKIVGTYNGTNDAELVSLRKALEKSTKVLDTVPDKDGEEK